MEKMNRTEGNFNSDIVIKKIVNVKNVIYIIFAVIIMYMAWCTPLTHDDIKLSKGIISIKSLCEFENGRFFANLLSLLFCKYEFVRILGKASVLFAIVILFQKIVQFDSIAELIFCMLLILYPSRNIFSESYTWTAGFSVYVPAVLFQLLIIYILKKMNWECNGKKYFFGVVIFAVSFIANLFVEHGTLLNTLLCVLYVFCLYKSKRKLRFAHICLVMGNMLGALIIFFVPSFFLKSQKITNYRTIALDLQHIKLVCTNIMTITRFFSGSVFLFVMLSVSLIYIMHLKKMKSMRAANIILILLPIYSMMLGNITNEYGWAISHAYFLHITCFVLLFSYVITVLYVLYKVNFKYKKEIQISFLSGLFTVLVLCVVSPIGGRTLYLPYICWSLMTMFAIREIAEQKANFKSLQFVILPFGMFFCVMLAIRFTCIRNIVVERENYLEQCIEDGEKKIILPTANVAGYIYCDSVDVDYGLIDVEMVPWEIWCNNK